MKSALRAVDLSMRFRSAMALNDLSLEVPEGSVFALLGPNGAGKTTTIRILMNILRPTSGHAEVLGKDSRLLRPEDFERIGYVSENQTMPDWMTVAYLFRYLEPFYPTWDPRRADELIRQFQLPPDRKLRHLSRGMWMKAALASSLAYRPRLLILDEPFTGLDPLVREDLIGGIIDTAGETTILISSHDLAEIESFATHVGYIDQGRLRFSEAMTSLTTRFREVEVTLDPPRGSPGRGPLALAVAAAGDCLHPRALRGYPLRSGMDCGRNSSAVRGGTARLGQSDAPAFHLPDSRPERSVMRQALHIFQKDGIFGWRQHWSQHSPQCLLWWEVNRVAPGGRRCCCASPPHI